MAESKPCFTSAQVNLPHTKPKEYSPANINKAAEMKFRQNLDKDLRLLKNENGSRKQSLITAMLCLLI